MAKDGTVRGGRRVGAGRKKKALSEKVLEGRAEPQELVTQPLDGADMPPVDEYMKAHQKNGIELQAERVFREVYAWIASRGCQEAVSLQLIKQYAMAVARWIQCENAVSEFGFLAKHPTTGAAMASPYVAMGREYMKQSNQCWLQIYQIVKENSTVSENGRNPQDDLMERLLTGR